ncbi:hypothetical protein [Flavobacterium caeni]|uniref:DUF4468 domain-containing protein n=1 Tax=Flavobacterium caeni TaxID=490189 RepID=A0A1G5H468_9FLAO|nr:hypothetical protein [Flavobacterium caeni]SCY58603.1 hypothetical protein SAMN02927903_01760 [Flavobacterium caeni]
MKKLILVAMMLASVAGFSQKVTSGSFKNLKGIPEFSLVFDYEGLTVEKFKSEEEFLADKMKKREEKGTGEDFRSSWFADRQNRYEPKFIESFNKRFKGNVKADKNLASAKHTMTVKTTYINPGFNVGVVRNDAKINVTITVTETANPSNVLLSVNYDRVHGEGAMGYDFNSGYRISEAYAKVAKELASDIK